MNLRITGPTPLPPEVRTALSHDMVSHRSAEFREVLAEVVSGLATVFGGPAAVLPFTCSGTGGLEAAVVNTIRPGQRVVVVSIGYFGQRLAEIVHMVGAEPEVIEEPWGRAADPERLRAVLRRTPEVAAVLLTHNETSTGVLNPLAELAEVVHEHSDALLIVDVVSSLGATWLRMADHGVDVAVGVPQKALMAPPGLALLGVSGRALAAAAANPTPRYYFDFTAMATAVDERTTTYTPAVPVVYALRAALRLMSEEGWDAVVARHRRLAARTRAGLAGLDLRLVAGPADASPTVTSCWLPEHMSGSAIRERLADRHGVLIGAGRGSWKERVLRIGHMGYVREADVTHALAALEDVLHEGRTHGDRTD